MENASQVSLRFERPRGGERAVPAQDAQLRRGILRTQMSRAVAFGLAGAFMLLIYALPITQAVRERMEDEPSSLAALFQRAPTQSNLRQFEHDIEQASYFKAYVQPRLQLLLSQLGGVGNKRVVLGRGGFLYYTPGVLHVAGPNFLDPATLAARAAQAPQDGELAHVQPDPRPAIFAFHDMLARRGITLVVFPVPDKAMLQPEQLHGRARKRGRIPVAHNPGWAEFAQQLRARGVKLFDPTPSALIAGEPPRFMTQDTHWTPGWMEQVAGELADFVQHESTLPAPATPRAWHTVLQPAQRVGDLVDMLKLPEDQTLFRPQTVRTARVCNAEDEPWQPDPGADVLLLGDSFTNVFSLDSMDWGEAAGLAPQLARALGRDVDVIAQNDSGAFATRELLFRELSSGSDRLRGKRVVIWEFAARELSVGDFKALPWDAAGAAGAP
jgi:alginate O-acetyltransferase complex protein AlgJ